MSAELRQLAADLGAAGPRVQKEARTVVRRTAMSLANTMSQAAPVDTGFLRSSIDTAYGSDGLAAIVSPTAHYAIYLENGTRFMSERPFVNPSADAIEPVFVSAMEQIGERIL